MNTNLGLIGKKLGNTQIFNEDGTVVRVTAVETGPCVVLGKKTREKDGYSAVQLGFGTKKPKRVAKPQKAVYDKLELQAPQVVREFRLPAEQVAQYEIGQTLKASEVFQVGQHVDISGISKGKGFAGVIKRHNFHGAGTVSHGTHEYKRHGGAIGMNMTPGRTLANQKMPGQHGNRRSTTLNIRVARVLEQDNLVLVEGSVPGPRNGVVTLRSAVKKPAPATTNAS